MFYFFIFWVFFNFCQNCINFLHFQINDIGTIILNEDGNYTFEPCEAGILTPELYGLGGLNMLPLAQISAEEVQKTEDSAASIIEMPAKTVVNNRTESEVKNQDSNQKMESGLSVNNSVFVNEEEESNAEFISIKKSWLRNIAAACIALIAFFNDRRNKVCLRVTQDTKMFCRAGPNSSAMQVYLWEGDFLEPE
jgi:hypothetical protein